MNAVNAVAASPLAGLLHVAKTCGEVALVVSLIYCACALLMSYLDKRSVLAEREAQAESEYWRTVRTDPRSSRR